MDVETCSEHDEEFELVEDKPLLDKNTSVNIDVDSVYHEKVLSDSIRSVKYSKSNYFQNP